MNKKILLIAIIACQPAAADWSYGIDLYGRSYHHNMPQGARDKLNESNIGYGVHTSKAWGKHSLVLDIGAFQNSYYDQAFWAGVSYRLKVFSHLEVGVTARHWETAHESYPNKLGSVYKTIGIPLTDKVRLWAYGGSGGGVAALGVDF